MYAARGARVTGVPIQRRLLSLAAAGLFKVLPPCSGVLDYTCGFRGYRVGVLQRALARYGDRLVSERESILRACRRLLADPGHYARMARAVSPYGDGHAAERIRDTLQAALRVAR